LARTARKLYNRYVLARAVIAFLALPGVVAFALPLTWALNHPSGQAPQPWGLLPLIVGIAGLLWCVRDFYVSGKGTLAPWSAPRRLVVVGLYRYSRNPMYVSVMLILLGWAACFASWQLLTYAVIVGFAFHLRVVIGEEPWLARTHGIEWDAYKARVPRWFGLPMKTTR
jgi:protein-S-isoprenylcysteine O-methyltransferase Ste14